MVAQKTVINGYPYFILISWYNLHRLIFWGWKSWLYVLRRKHHHQMSVGQESPGLLNEPGLACDLWCILLLSSSHYLWTVGQTFEFGHHLKESESGWCAIQWQHRTSEWWQGPMTATHGYSWPRNVEATIHKPITRWLTTGGNFQFIAAHWVPEWYPWLLFTGPSMYYGY